MDDYQISDFHDRIVVVHSLGYDTAQDKQSEVDEGPHEQSTCKALRTGPGWSVNACHGDGADDYKIPSRYPSGQLQLQ